MNYIIRIVQPPNDIHWQCFYEVAKGISYSLEQLGHNGNLDLERQESLNNARVIAFNVQSLPPQATVPDNTIIFNGEQIPRPGQVSVPWWPAYRERLNRYVVWDYSLENIERLRVHGIRRVVHCPVGYYPGLSNIESRIEDIDVLFAGCMNSRRQKIVEDLNRRGLIVKPIVSAYGRDRDRWIQRSKIILNVHYYGNPIWEVFRVSHALANKKCVVSEDGGCDQELETLAMATTAHVSYDKIVDKCCELVAGIDARQKTAETGFQIFSRLSQTDFVRAALEKS